jgi:hypothetical protein
VGFADNLPGRGNDRDKIDAERALATAKEEVRKHGSGHGRGDAVKAAESDYRDHGGDPKFVH